MDDILGVSNISTKIKMSTLPNVVHLLLLDTCIFFIYLLLDVIACELLLYEIIDREDLSTESFLKIKSLCVVYVVKFSP